MSLESGYGTDLSVPTYPKQEYHRLGLRQEGSARTVRLVQPAEESTESAARRAPVYRRHRSKESEECAAREPERAWIFLEVVGDSKVSGEREPLRVLSNF